jgi:hypothetical protein
VHDVQIALALVVTSGAGFLMVASGLHKRLLERPHARLRTVSRCSWPSSPKSPTVRLISRSRSSPSAAPGCLEELEGALVVVLLERRTTWGSSADASS